MKTLKYISVFLFLFLRWQSLHAICLDQSPSEFMTMTSSGNKTIAKNRLLAIYLYSMANMQRTELYRKIEDQIVLSPEKQSLNNNCVRDFIMVDSLISSVVVENCNLNYQRLGNFPELMDKIQRVKKVCDINGFDFLFDEYLDTYFDPNVKAMAEQMMDKNRDKASSPRNGTFDVDFEFNKRPSIRF